MSLVSVIIPNYNHAGYLKERIESIINQTYENIEIIILDDKSTDNSQDIIEAYRTHPKITCVIYNNINTGRPFRQWLKGIELAKGDYIWIAESDDYCDNSFVNNCMEVFKHNRELSLVFCNSIIVNENLITNEYTNNTAFISGIYSGDSIIDYWILRNDGLRPVNASSVIFKKGNFPLNKNLLKKFKYSGDKYFWYCLMLGNKVGYISQCLNFYRRHKKSATAVVYGNIKKNDRYFEEIVILNIIKKSFVNDFFIIKSLKKKFIQKHMIRYKRPYSFLQKLRSIIYCEFNIKRIYY